jgi:hypothetical protein
MPGGIEPAVASRSAERGAAASRLDVEYLGRLLRRHARASNHGPRRCLPGGCVCAPPPPTPPRTTVPPTTTHHRRPIREGRVSTTPFFTALPLVVADSMNLRRRAGAEQI